MEPFAAVPEQAEAKRLLGSAVRDGPAHAYLLHGPAGVGKRPPRSPSRPRCSATSAACSPAPTPTCTCSSRSAR